MAFAGEAEKHIIFTKNLSSMGTGSAINYESLANICKKFPQTLTELTESNNGRRHAQMCFLVLRSQRPNASWSSEHCLAVASMAKGVQKSKSSLLFGKV